MLEYKKVRQVWTLQYGTSRMLHGQEKGQIQGVKNKKKAMFFKNFEASFKTSKTSLKIFKAFKKSLTKQVKPGFTNYQPCGLQKFHFLTI